MTGENDSRFNSNHRFPSSCNATLSSSCSVPFASSVYTAVPPLSSATSSDIMMASSIVHMVGCFHSCIHAIAPPKAKQTSLMITLLESVQANFLRAQFCRDAIQQWRLFDAISVNTTCGEALWIYCVAWHCIGHIDFTFGFVAHCNRSVVQVVCVCLHLFWPLKIIHFGNQLRLCEGR